MKLLIAICEDDRTTNAEIEKALEEILSKQNIVFSIESYYSAKKFCDKLENGANYDLIILDIEYRGESLNGVDVGKRIRKIHQNNSVSIVYISWEVKYSMELHDLQPLNFLIKPIEYKKIEKVVMQHINIFSIRASCFTYKIGYESYRMQIRDIAYVESRNRKLILHMASGEQVEFYGSLKAVYEEQLQKYDFLLIHASYVVNFDFIVRYTRDAVIMGPSDVNLLISQNRRSDIRKRYLYIDSRRDG